MARGRKVWRLVLLTPYSGSTRSFLAALAVALKLSVIWQSCSSSYVHASLHTSAHEQLLRLRYSMAPIGAIRFHCTTFIFAHLALSILRVISAAGPAVDTAVATSGKSAGSFSHHLEHMGLRDHQESCRPCREPASLLSFARQRAIQ